MDKETAGPVKTLLDEIKAKLETMDSKIDTILQVNKNTSSVPDPYEGLNWRNYRSGKEGSWIFADAREVAELVKKLKEAKGHVIFTEGYRYSLSEDGRFIRRDGRKS